MRGTRLATYALCGFRKEGDSSPFEASDLGAHVIEIEYEVNPSTIPAGELAEMDCKRDRYGILLYSVVAQAQGLQNGYSEIICRANSSQCSCRDRLKPLLENC